MATGPEPRDRLDRRVLDPTTLAVSLGRAGRRPGDPVNAPVQLSAVLHAGAEVTYGRDVNATWEAFEEVLGALEGGTALAFASGMAATAAVVETLPVGAGVSVGAGAYNGTRRLLNDLASRGRIRLVGSDDADLVWVESPSNPLLEITDIASVVAAAHARGALVAVDNTFATPLVQQPLRLGADVVVHSVTKLLAGHSDIVMGAVVVDDADLLELLRTRRSLHGAIAGPVETFLALRGVRTLPVRLERATATAGVLAERLAGHRAVSRVRYPGFGTIVSFHVAGGAAAAEGACARVRLITPATSLGGVESLMERRHHYAGEENIPPELIRLSVGLEHVDDLWADLDQALNGD